MTREELIDALKACIDDGVEEGHMSADRLLIRYINDPEIAEAYEQIPKWYA